MESNASGADGHIRLIDKPKGLSSFDVIRVLRRQTGIRKMGHAGTLDPLATGLLIVAFGKATKALHTLAKLPKIYDTEVLLGARTATGDRDGEVIERASVPEIEEKRIRKTLQEMKGVLILPVPKYSAVKVGGRRLYDMARRGETIQPPMRAMEVFRLELNGYRPLEDRASWILDLTAEVASGTYVRSLAEEIGKRLGFPASIWELRRTSIGDFHVRDAEQLIRPTAS